jgi:phosphoribosylglycinamide formyltransferase-1
MKYGLYLSREATRFRLSLKNNIINAKDISFALVDYIVNSDLCDICRQFSIPLYQYSYEELGLKQQAQNEFISNMFLKLLNQYNTNYGFVIGGRKLLIGELLQRYKNKLINFHPSLLPLYKGRFRAIDIALAENNLLLGNTAHFIIEEADAGPVIMQSIIPAKQVEDYDSVLNLQLPMLKQIIIWLENDRVFVDHDKVVIRDACYKLDTYIPNLEYMYPLPSHN